MVKKIVVVGAGHGGLIAAAYLAQNGFIVELFEKNSEKEMGYKDRGRQKHR